MSKEELDSAKNILKLVVASKVNPEKYKNVQSFEELDELLADSPEELEVITTGIKDIVANIPGTESDDEKIFIFVKNLTEEEDSEMTYAKKGAKLNYIATLRKGRKVSIKKCACGCDMVTLKEKGGKMVTKCACGCKNK